MRLFFSGLLLVVCIAVTAQDHYLFVGTYTGKGSEGIYVYKFNTTSGEMLKVSTAMTENPSYLAITKDKKFVYSVNENGEGKGGVTAFSFDDASGRLTALNSQLSNGDHPCYISVDNSGKWVVVGNYTGGNLSVYPVKNDGSLGEAVQIIAHTGSGGNKKRQDKPHVHSVVFTPDEKFLAVADLGTDKIYMYPFDATADKPLNETAIETSTAPGSGPRHIIFHKSLPYAYTIEELSGKVSAYKVNGDGKLTELQSISSHPAGYKDDIGSAAIKISTDGKNVYASNRGASNTIATFTVDQSTGKLKLTDITASGGKAPRDFTIDPTDHFILAANGGSDNVTIFKRNAKTGAPEGNGKQVSISQPVSLLFY